MPDSLIQRRQAAMRTCDRILSGVRPLTMRERLAVMETAADLDGMPDFYGGGPVTVLERRVAALLGTQDAVLFPTGTMAQQVALRYGAERIGIPAAALHPLGHQEVHERHAYAELTGLRGIRSTSEPRNPTAAEIATLAEPVSTVVIELPLRDAGFVLPAWPELVEVTKAARGIGARVHFDGARIWECAPYLGRSVREIAALADSVYVSFYKTLGGISGAALAGTADLTEYARNWRHRYGGHVFQQWPVALSALAGLDGELPRIPEYVAHARTVADALAGLPGARVFPHPPHTHQFRLWLPCSAAALNEAVLAMAEQEGVWFAGGWTDADVPGYAMTEVTVAGHALEWTCSDISSVGVRLLDRLN
ncbi:beta-eliminating lyase-related protein [Actinoplanes sp. NPDC049802]|uniref:threonine aldolase family protein n=1 Tax=Actinoplanes sp. NPDC049802 TaxID=3154742 RepID=UPI003401C88C